jgi:hypothetical protein
LLAAAGTPVYAVADGTAARFRPTGVSTDSAGNVYVSDTGNNTIRAITPSGVVTTLAGMPRQPPGSTDGADAAAYFNFPGGVATDSGGNVYVADTNNHTIRKITPGGVVSTLAGTAGLVGSTDGIGSAARFYYPRGMATDSVGNVYVADSINDTIRMITPAGVVTTFAGSAAQPGSTDGTGAAARFNSPSGVATDSAGNVYVADSGNNTIRKITSAGVVTTLAGTAGQTGTTDGVGAVAQFYYPTAVATDSASNVYVADTNNILIRKITPSGDVGTLAGIRAGQGVVTDKAGNVYVAAYSSIQKVTPAGVTTTFAGGAPGLGAGGYTGPLPGSCLSMEVWR